MNAQDRLIGAAIWTFAFLIVALVSLAFNNIPVAAGLIVGAMVYSVYSLYSVLTERRKTLKQ